MLRSLPRGGICIVGPSHDSVLECKSILLDLPPDVIPRTFCVSFNFISKFEAEVTFDLKHVKQAMISLQGMA